MNVLATINSYDDLHELLRRRAEQLELSRLEIDGLAGLSPGHASRLLSPQPMKRIGPETFKFLLPALGIALIAIEDLQSMERIRLAPKRHSASASHAGTVRYIISRRELRKRQRNGGKNSRKYLSKTKTRALARKAGAEGNRIRWAQVKEAVRSAKAP